MLAVNSRYSPEEVLAYGEVSLNALPSPDCPEGKHLAYS
jgi:hypothetical protein